jgi:hypothetical protein
MDQRPLFARFLLGLLLAALPAALSAQVTIVVAGTSSAGIRTALTNMDRAFTNAGSTMGPDPATYSLKAGDFIIISNDGGTDATFFDYTNFLNAGGRVILVGGSNYQPYRDWVSGYFNLTHTEQTWHTNSLTPNWTTLAAGQSYTSGLPNTYNFENNSATYHMLGFLETTNTVLYGQNGEGIAVGAYRSYSNGGSLNYLAFDVGNGSYVTTGDINNFVIPWLRASLAIPEPSTYALFGTGLAVLALRARRRRP